MAAEQTPVQSEQPPLAAQKSAETDPAAVLDAGLRQRLVSLLRAAYPHPDLPDGPYERTADEVISQAGESTWLTIILREGLASLDAAADGDFEALDETAKLELLRQIEDAEFFVFVRGVTVVALYNDHETWKVLGYEGPSFDQGGYLHRGFDDLDWLPDPRIEEYDGPEELVEVADDDQPKEARA